MLYKAFKAVTMKMPSSGMLRLEAFVRSDISEESISSIVRVTRIGELGKMLAVNSIASYY
jgi:hypothetical protein